MSNQLALPARRQQKKKDLRPDLGAHSESSLQISHNEARDDIPSIPWSVVMVKISHKYHSKYSSELEMPCASERLTHPFARHLLFKLSLLALETTFVHA